MIPYISIYGFLTLLAFAKNFQYSETIVFLVLALFLNLSYTNGIDWTAYQTNYIYDPTYTRGVEYGYTAITILARSLGLNFEVFKFFLLSLDLYLILRFIFKKSPKPVFAILILFQTYLLGNFFEPAIRQIQSVVIFLFALDALRKNNTKKYILLILFATLFHQSSIVLLSLPLFIKRLNFKISILFMLVLGAVGLQINNAVLFLVQYGIFSDYSFYLESSYLEGISPSAFNLLKIVIYGIPLYLLRSFRRTDPTIEILRALSYMFVIFYCLQFFALIFYRFNHYFFIPYVIYLSYFFQALRIPSNKFIIISFYVLIHFISLIKGITYYSDRDPMKYFPYTNYAVALIVGNTYSSPEEKINARLSSRWAHLTPFLEQ
ncbi:EpsG family protein [Pseudophaeobacter sp. TrK17]|uniref:EpsG family protein n=1 Tax=Pseudophaeobacter sp. TrK17 TaxID=2815167 RepID=UPI0035CF2A8D